MTMTHADRSRRTTLQHLLVGVLYVGLAALVSVLSPEHLDLDAGQRVLFAVMGALVAYYGNAAARTLTPLAEMRDDPAVEQALRRFSAWSITLGGIGFSLAWLVLPLSLANAVAVALLGTSVLLALARWMWASKKGRRG